MTGARQSADAARSAVSDALADGKRKKASSRTRPVGARAVLALQRSAGNSAVGALMAAKFRSPGGQGGADIDAALTEVRRDDPVIDTVEKGLKAAQAVGIPVDLEGPKPPASALAVTMTGFGPGSVAEKKVVPPPKPVPAVNPLGKAAAKPPHPGGPGSADRAAAPPMSGADTSMMSPATPSADQLLQEPVPPEDVRPHDDPAFTQVTGHVASFAKVKKAHPPAASKAREAQAAALAPTGDIPGQAKAAKVDAMDAQPAGSFDKKAFIAAVKTAIEAKSPKTLKEADDYKESGKAGEVKGDIKGLVTSGKEGQAKDIETATNAPPDESKAVAKPVTPMGPEEPGQAAAIPAAGAAPKTAPPEQLNLEAGKQQANQEMAGADVSEPQLAESNEPEFQQAVVDKHTAAEHADTAPAEFRQHEKDAIEQGKADAAAETTTAVGGMHGSKVAALAHLVADKGKTKSKDEAKRAEVTAKIQGIFTAAEADVKKILDGIDPKVEAAFDTGEAGARAAFESYVDAKMSAYKEDRYSGWLGGLRWAKDKLLGMPDKVNEFYEAGREIYLKQMDNVISKVADIVGTDLTAAKTRIASGKAEIAAYVKSLPAELKKVGAEASTEIGEKFGQLEDDVNSKQESVVDTLATKYTQARKGLDDRIEELQAANKGLVDKAIGAIKAVINTIRELASMLMNVLARVAGVVGDIIKHPVKFLSNLIDGVKGGILKFKDTILDHLRKGLMSWLFGALGEAGVEIPDTFDLKGIIKLLGSIFGMTWANIRNRLVRKIGEKAMSAAEKGVEIFQLISREGIGGLWQMLVDKLGDLKEMILEQVKDFVITKIITAGITWLIGLLNPAAAFIKACKLIYDIVMFFVTNASRIMAFVNTVIDSVADMVRGNVSAVIDKIDDVLGKMVPILIGFLANLVGLGGVGQKVREIVEKLQKPVTKALDFVINTGLKLAGPIIRGIKGISGRVKAKVAAGKAFVKGKVEAGKKWATLGAIATAEKVGLIRRPVHLGNENKTLSANLKTGAVVLRATASDAAPDAASRAAVAAEEQSIRHLTRTGTPEKAPVANHLRRIGDMLVEAHRRIGGPRGAPGAVPPTGALNVDQRQVQGALANPVRRHGENSGLVPRGNRPRELWLESEHIVPVSWVGIALRLLGQRAINRQEGMLDIADDKSMHTVLLYEQASRLKTDEERPIFQTLEAIIEEVLPHRLQEGSRSEAARALRARTTRTQRDAMRSGWQARVSRLRSRLLDALHGQLNASVGRAERAVVSDHTPSKHAVRGHVPPMPQPAHIRTAATLQLDEIARILSERVKEMFPAESALAEAQHDENVREDLRKGEQARGSGPPAGYKQLPSGLFVPAGMPGEE